jgi:hypothetical protein
VTRDELVREYDRLMRQLVKQGSEPVVTDAVLDCFTDAELGLLVKDSAMRLSLLLRRDLK